MRSGSAGHRHPATASKLKDPLVAQDPKGAENGVGVDPQHGREVLGWWESLSGASLAIGDGPSNLCGHLVMEGDSLGTVNLDLEHDAMDNSTMLTRSKGAATPAPTEDLFPEAREHQRRRYLRFGVIAILSALLVAALIAAGVILFAGPATGGRSSVVRPAVASVAKSPSVVYFRPVFCYAPPYEGSGASASAPTPTCSPASQLSNQNLNVDPSSSSPQGYATNNVPVDASLADVPSTRPSADKSSSTVLLPGLKTAHNSTGERYVLGPAQMSSGAIASASVSNRGGQWAVDFTMTGAGVRYGTR